MAIAVPHLKPIVAPPRWAKDELWRKAQAVPSLDLNFASTKSLVDATTGAELVTFTRTSDGTATNSLGNLIVVPANTPRFDHDPMTGESLGLLVEEQRTNLLLSSEEFNSASWVASAGVTVTADSSQGSPSAFSQVYRIDYSGANLNFSQGVTGVSGLTYTLSIYIKGTAGKTIRLSSANMTGATNFTLTGGWQRISITGTSSATNLNFGLSTFGGVTARTIYVTAAQLEAGAFATSYIPTGASAVTRAASLGDLISSAIANNIRSFYVEFRSPAVGTRGVVSLNDNTANERASVITSGTDPRLVVHDGGVEQANINGGTVSAGVRTRIAVRLNENDFAISINGGAVVTDTSGTLPTVDRLMLGRTQAGEYLNGTIARLTGWTQPLANSTLQTLSQ
jgi:hypothetical protein